MIELPQPQRIADWFRPERPGPLIGPHVLQTGHGRIRADRPDAPRAVLVETGGDNFDLSGDPSAFRPGGPLRGIFRADQAFEAVLRDHSTELHRWPRVIYELQAPARDVVPVEAEVRRLVPADARALDALSPETHWITETWAGPPGAAAGGLAFGAFVDGALASVAIPFYVGERYEDIGVITEEPHRARGLSAACANAVVKDVLSRGRRPTWSTSPDNIASRRVAAKLGFRFVRSDLLYLVGRSI
ncbi:GNAT family N-acetyltransferase [Actinocorallia longicatena]|uniref:N-acetyltransferase domain-containing protein n=1 Tax=Actinocorallia longicatena TaxID=111803 RepID=A0ABP6Q8H8_9ACTN